jgi:glycosyltransferase involved in cell wall biosynthesis
LWEASTRLGYLLEYSWALLAELCLALKIFRKTRFRILQACNPPDVIFLVALSFKLLGVRFIFDHHDLNPELYEAKFGHRGLVYKLVCLMERLSFRVADISMAPNESFRKIAITRGRVRANRVFVVRSTPELAALRRDTAEPALKEGRKYLVLYLGVMGPQDGVDLLIESISHVVASGHPQDTLFALIGSGTEVPRLKQLVGQKGLDAFVRFTGPLYGTPLHAYLSSADVGVAPDPVNTFNNNLTTNKVLEYMAFGKPVVMYDLVEGRRSAGECALYARANDPTDFACQILKLLDSEILREQLGKCGRKRIEDQLNWEQDKRSLIEAYQTALSVP